MKARRAVQTLSWVLFVVVALYAVMWTGVAWLYPDESYVSMRHASPLPTGTYQMSMVVNDASDATQNKVVSVSTDGTVFFATLPPLPLVTAPAPVIHASSSMTLPAGCVLPTPSRYR